MNDFIFQMEPEAPLDKAKGLAPGKILLRRRQNSSTRQAQLRIPPQYSRQRSAVTEGIAPQKPPELFPRISKSRNRISAMSNWIGADITPPSAAGMTDEMEVEKEEISMDDALDKVHRVYGPDKIFVWNFEIILFVGVLGGMFEIIGLLSSNYTGSTPTLALWALGSVLIATGVLTLGMVLASFVSRQMIITDHRFQSVANGTLTVVVAVFVLWVFYGTLVLGARETPSINEQLAKLLFPVVFPWQDAYFIVGTAALVIVVMLYFFISHATTMRTRPNRVFVHTSFTYLLTVMTILIQEAANHGIVVCDVRSSPWVTNYGNRYGIWNDFYFVFGLINGSLVICFCLQMLGDYQVQTILGYPLVQPVYVLLNLALQTLALVVFLIADPDAALGKRERIFAPGVEAIYHSGSHLGFTLGIMALQFTMALFALFNYDETNKVIKRMLRRHESETAGLSRPVNSVLPTLDFNTPATFKTD